jgi:15-cis-phytoene synthase
MTDNVLAEARAALAQGSQSFAAATRLMRSDLRDDATLLYAWCRHCDDAVDGQHLGHDRHPVADAAGRLRGLRRATDAALAGAPAAPPFAALARVCGRHAIPRAHPHELLNGLAMDADARRYDTLSDTLDYCYHAAGVVGVMMARIMGVADPTALHRAADLGIAFQLTNIARDVVEDAKAGRCYLPGEVLAAEGVTARDLCEPGAWPRAHRIAMRLLDVAEPYYASGFRGLSALPGEAVWGIAAARRVYGAIGDRIRHATPQDWANRVATSRMHKIGALALAAFDGPRARRMATAPRDGLWTRDDQVSERSLP